MGLSCSTTCHAWYIGTHSVRTSPRSFWASPRSGLGNSSEVGFPVDQDGLLTILGSNMGRAGHVLPGLRHIPPGWWHHVEMMPSPKGEVATSV